MSKSRKRVRWQDERGAFCVVAPKGKSSRAFRGEPDLEVNAGNSARRTEAKAYPVTLPYRCVRPVSGSPLKPDRFVRHLALPGWPEPDQVLQMAFGHLVVMYPIIAAQKASSPIVPLAAALSNGRPAQLPATTFSSFLAWLVGNPHGSSDLRSQLEIDAIGIGAGTPTTIFNNKDESEPPLRFVSVSGDEMHDQSQLNDIHVTNVAAMEMFAKQTRQKKADQKHKEAKEAKAKAKASTVDFLDGRVRIEVHPLEVRRRWLASARAPAATYLDLTTEDVVEENKDAKDAKDHKDAKDAKEGKEAKKEIKDNNNNNNDKIFEMVDDLQLVSDDLLDGQAPPAKRAKSASGSHAASAAALEYGDLLHVCRIRNLAVLYVSPGVAKFVVL